MYGSFKSWLKLKIVEKFTPHPNLKKVYGVYLLLSAIPILVVTILPILAVFNFELGLWRSAWSYTFIPLIIALLIIGFVVYWIPKYLSSICYVLTEDEVIVERGV